MAQGGVALEIYKVVGSPKIHGQAGMDGERDTEVWRRGGGMQEIGFYRHVALCLCRGDG